MVRRALLPAVAVVIGLNALDALRLPDSPTPGDLARRQVESNAQPFSELIDELRRSLPDDFPVSSQLVIVVQFDEDNA